MLTTEEIKKIRKFVKKVRKEGTSSGAAGAFLTPNAFVGDEDAEGSEKGIAAGAPYKIKPSKEKKNFVPLHERSYQDFKKDDSHTHAQKINKRILEISRSLREISRALDHSLRLREETQDPDHSPYWNKTNEAILKIHNRLAEIVGKTEKLANLKELASNQLQKKLTSLIKAAGVSIDLEDVQCAEKGGGNYECDVFINGEPTSLDVKQNKLILQDYESEEVLGDLSRPSQTQTIIDKLRQLLPK